MVYSSKNTRKRGNKYVRAVRVAATLARAAAPYVARAGRGLMTRLANRGVPRKLRRNNVSGRNPNPMKAITVRSMGGGSPSMSFFNCSFRPDRRAQAIKKIGSPNTFVTNFASRLEVAEGYQNAVSFRWTGIDHLLKMRDLIQNAPAPVQLWQNGGRYVLNSLVGELLITNSSLATTFLDIYDITMKRDYKGDATSPQTPVDLWSNQQYQTDGTPQPDDFQIINSLPTDSVIFKDFLSVKRRVHVALTQGATHRHKINHRFTKLVDNVYIASLNNGSPNACSKGLTTFTMLVAYGQPAALKQDTTVVTTTAAIALDCVQSWRYKYTFCEDKANQFYAVDNLTSLAGEQIVNIGSGAIETNAVIYP